MVRTLPFPSFLFFWEWVADADSDVVLARDMVKEVEHPTCGPIKLVNTPVKFSDTQPNIRTPPPTLGQHTDEVLGGLLGMEAEEIEGLRREGVVA